MSVPIIVMMGVICTIITMRYHEHEQNINSKQEQTTPTKHEQQEKQIARTLT